MLGWRRKELRRRELGQCPSRITALADIYQKEMIRTCYTAARWAPPLLVYLTLPLSEASHTNVLRIIYRAGQPLRPLRATASLVIPASVEAHDLLRGDRETTQSVSDTLVNARKSAFDPKRCEAAKLTISHLPTLCQRR